MRILALVFAVTLFSCKEPSTEFKQYSDDISYKYLQLGDEKDIDETDVLEMQLLVVSEKYDTLHYAEDYHYFLEPSSHVLDTVFRSFYVQDSIQLRIKRSLFNEYFKPVRTKLQIVIILLQQNFSNKVLRSSKLKSFLKSLA